MPAAATPEVLEVINEASSVPGLGALDRSWIRWAEVLTVDGGFIDGAYCTSYQAVAIGWWVCLWMVGLFMDAGFDE